jgi:hypothetical protein
VYEFTAMKRSRRIGKSSTRGAGWTAETYQESNSDDGLGQQPRQRPRDLHPHTIVNATPAGTQSSIVNAFAEHSNIPKPAPKPFLFVDTPASSSNDFTFDNDLEMNLETMFQEYGLMDPKLSAAWDEDHGLKAKRARTASVWESASFWFDFFLLKTSL